jgi:hypothetical protein
MVMSRHALYRFERNLKNLTNSCLNSEALCTSCHTSLSLLSVVYSLLLPCILFCCVVLNMHVLSTSIYFVFLQLSCWTGPRYYFSFGVPAFVMGFYAFLIYFFRRYTVYVLKCNMSNYRVG